MKIYRATEYVQPEEREQPWYALKVKNQWNFKDKVVCYDYAGAVLIGYCLELCTKTGEGSWKTEKIELLNEDMRQELIKMGYRVSNSA